MYRNTFITSLLIFTSFLYCKAEETDDEASDVVVLTSDNFDDFLEQNDMAIIEFYAPWCGHCKQFAPTYELIATELKGEIQVAKVDADEHKDPGSKFDVSGFPTIIVWKNGDGHQYKGGRTQEDLVKYAREVADPNWAPPKSQVDELTSENFDTYIAENPFALVMFYAPWCGHCKKIKPAFDDAAGTLAGIDHDGQTAPKLAKLDATVHNMIAKRYDVTGYPTLKVFRKGIAGEYKGGREANEIVEELMKQSGPASTPFETVNSAKRMLTQTKGNSAVSVFYGCFALETGLEPDSESEEFERFLGIATEFREEWLVIRHTFDEEVKAAVNCKDGDMFLVHDVNFRSTFEKDRIPIASSEDIVSNMTPLVGAYQKATKEWLYPMPTTTRDRVVITGFLDFSHKYQKASQLTRAKVLPVAAKYPQYQFVLMDEDAIDNMPDINSWGLQDSPEDFNIIILSGKKIYKFECEDGFSGKVLESILKKYQDGTMERHIKSAKAPKKNNGPVKVVVADQFDKIVMSKKSDVLIEFYAPWCGHCKTLAPIYKKLGKKVADQSDLVIAKFDAIANDVPNDAFEVKGFPTLYWVDKANNIEKYGGGRELADLTAFLEKKRGGATKDEL